MATFPHSILSYLRVFRSAWLCDVQFQYKLSALNAHRADTLPRFPPWFWQTLVYEDFDKRRIPFIQSYRMLCLYAYLFMFVIPNISCCSPVCEGSLWICSLLAFISRRQRCATSFSLVNSFDVTNVLSVPGALVPNWSGPSSVFPYGSCVARKTTRYSDLSDFSLSLYKLWHCARHLLALFAVHPLRSAFPSSRFRHLMPLCPARPFSCSTFPGCLLAFCPFCTFPFAGFMRLVGASHPHR